MAARIYKTQAGKVVPGTTTAIGELGWNKRQLMYWSWQEGLEGRDYRESQQAAADAGTLAHILAETYNKTAVKEVTIPKGYTQDAIDLAVQAFKSYLDWVGQTKLVITASEVSLVSEEHEFGGTLDAIGVDMNNGDHLIDFKTAKDVYTENLLQLAAYGILWEEARGTKVVGYHVVRFGKVHGDFHHHHYPPEVMLKAKEAFLASVRLYKLHKELKKVA